MTPDEFQDECHKTAIYPSQRGVEYLALGLTSEAGEVAGKIKKQLRDGHDWTGEQREEVRRGIIKELGDCMWYIAEMCTLYGVPLSTAMTTVLEKLKSRAERSVIGGSGDNR